MKKVLLILFVLVSFSGFAQAVANTSQDDNLILEEVLKNTKKTLEGKYALILLSPSANNNFVVKVVEEYKGGSDIVSQVDRNDEVLKQIFNEKGYEHLLSQRSNEKWDISKIKADKVLFYEEDMDVMAPGSKMLTVGKPVYASDKKYALVYLNGRTWSGVDVFKNEGGKWSEYKLIHPFSFQSKAKLKRGYCMLLENILLNPKVAAYLHRNKKGRETLYVIENDFCAMDAEINGILVKTIKDAKIAKSKNYIEIRAVKEIEDKTVVELSYLIEGVSIKAVFDSKDGLLDIDVIEK